MKEIPIIDLFAGPGGLGEGFSSVIDEKGKRKFNIRLSIEMDEHAHQTLLYRSFFRQFDPGQAPKEYYEVIMENDPKLRLEKKQKLFEKYPAETKSARKEAWNCELGNENFPSDVVDRRIKEALNAAKDWVLIGGPPCQAFSMAGRSRVGGIDENDHRVFLYKEYLRIIAAHQPSVFVMENVRGLLSAKLNDKSIFEMILKDLRNPGSIFTEYNSQRYKIYSFVKKPKDLFSTDEPEYESGADFLIRAERYGIPQKRYRVILLGIRQDCEGNTPETLEESGKQLTLREVIGTLPQLRSGLSKRIIDTKIKNNRMSNRYEKIIDTPETWTSIINHFKKEHSKCEEVKVPKHNKGENFIQFNEEFSNKRLRMWYKDSKLKGICNHESRNHLESDLERYLFAAEFLKTHDRFPRMSDYPYKLLPEHRSASSGKFNDRFRVQVPDQPATTVTSHISKDGHYFIHYDPEQCRSLTVREAARIQTFPDNYFFWGNRTQQYHQVGNAVPPMLAKKLAEIVLKVLIK